MLKMYIAVLDEFPDYMTPTLVAHSVLNAHLKFEHLDAYKLWLTDSFKKCVVRVSRKEAGVAGILQKLKNVKLLLTNMNQLMNPFMKE